MKIGYARVSTLDQSPQMQIDALKEAGCERIFEEQVSSGKDRPTLEQALSYCRSGDTLVVWKLDRLARSTKELLAIAERLEGQGIGLLCLTQPIDTTTAGGRLVFTIFSAMAEFERDLIRERTRSGLASAKARGKTGGRPALLTQKQVEMAKTLLKNSELSAKDVAKQLKVSISTLYRYVPRAKA